MSTSRFSFSSGSLLVIIILLLGGVGSFLTVWNYSRHVFSSNQARLIDSQGTIVASFSSKEQGALRLHDKAIVTLTGRDSPSSLKAEVIFLSVEGVTLRLLEAPSPILPLGTPCSVTIDTTIPIEP